MPGVRCRPRVRCGGGRSRIACTRCDFSGKEKAPPLDGADEGLLLSRVTDGAARRIDPAVQRGVGYDAAFPDGFDQLILADDPVGVADKVQEQIEDLWLDMNDTLAALELSPVGVDRKIIELEQQVIRISLWSK